jgi:hypothetical protein
MINSFPQSQNTDMRMLLEAFKMACDGLAPEAVIMTARNYISGRVEGHNARYAPSVAEFAKTARVIAADMIQLPAISAPKDRPINPAYRAQIERRMRLLAKVTRRPRYFERLTRAVKNTPIQVPMYLDEAQT